MPSFQPPASRPQPPPSPPWTLRGSALILGRDWRSLRAWVNYDESPVGPYREAAIIALRRVGWRVAPSVTAMLVDSAESRRGGRENWGFPKELASLHWQRRGRRVECGPRFVLEDAQAKAVRPKYFDGTEYSDGVWRARLWGPAFPLRGAWRTRQTLRGREVRAPFHLCATARLAWRGRQLGLFLEKFTMTFLPPQFIDGK